MDDVVVLSSSATRHSCKVCGKGFPCGRSLGGHMRSHSLTEVAAVAADDADADDDDERRWIQRGARGSNGVVGAGGGGYGLRENPKKTRRLSGSGGDGDGDGDGDACHDRVELFSSCRSVLGHIRRHAPGGGGYADGQDASVGVEEGPEEEEEMLIPSEAAVVMAAPAPRRRRRSMRVPAPAPTPACDAFDKEPEDVALCLIMLSRDTASLWRSTANEESSPEKGTKKRDILARNGYYRDADSDDSALLQYADPELTKSKKRKTAPGNAGEKQAGYECPSCGRAFRSYQALGGHRASHKRINSSCCIAKVPPDQPEPSIETNASFSTPSTPASQDVVAADIADRAVTAVKAKKVTKFECPICFKVFSSGQALGGHKRSHSVASELYACAHADGDAGIVDTEQSLNAAGFLDLNLPAPGAEN